MRAMLLTTIMALGLSVPALAQAIPETSPRQRVVTVFGTEACPRSSDPDEIIVCRRSMEDPARLPEAIRNEQKVARRDNVPGTSAALVGTDLAAGACSGVGSMGQLGCSKGGIDMLGGAKKIIEALDGEDPIPTPAPQ